MKAQTGIAAVVVILALFVGAAERIVDKRSGLPVPQADWPRRCAPNGDDHIQMVLRIMDGKLFAECGACGNLIPLRCDWGTNDAQVTLKGIAEIMTNIVAEKLPRTDFIIPRIEREFPADKIK